MAPRKPQKPSTELALPAKAAELSGSVISFDPANAQKARDQYSREVAIIKRRNYKALAGYTAAAAFGGFFFTMALPAAGIFGGIWATVVTGTALLAAGGSFMDSNETQAHNASYAAERSLKETFRDAQKKAHHEIRKQLVGVAQAHVEGGNLLDEESLAYLVTLTPDYLREAGDKLAITVLQARKMLAHMRYPDQVQKPVTFAAMEFNAASEKHRRFMREKLEAGDNCIGEDIANDYEGLEFSERPRRKPGFKHFMRGLAGPFFMASDLKRYRSFSIPDLPDVPVQTLRPAKDFALTLHRYEEKNEKLDLPALRGWPRQMKALPKPPKY